jgi:Rrf2 family iron-sulfur cluster assembly transcriptional regulator
MTHELWATLNEKMYEYLSSVTLGDLVARQRQKVAAGETVALERVTVLEDKRQEKRRTADAGA